MNFRTTVILLILLVGAAVFYFVANRADDSAGQAKTPPKEDNEKGKLLLDVKSADVRKLVIRPGEGAPAGAKLLELSQTNGKWNILQPINWPADSFDASNLVDAVTSARSGGSVDLTPEKSASMGLAKPRYRIEVTDAAGKVSKLTVGDRSPLGYLYVQTSDDKTASILTGGPLAERLSKTTDKVIATLRDKQILRVSSLDVKQVRVQRPDGPALAFEKPAFKPGSDSASEWRMTAPVTEPVETSEASDLISTLTNLRADEFSDEAAATSSGSFDRPQAVVTLSATAPATQPSTTTAPSTKPFADLPGGVIITIGQPVDIEGEKCWVKVSDPPTVAKVSLNKAAVEKITKASPLSLRDRKVFAADPAQVSEVTITTETSSTTKPAEQTTTRLVRRHEKTELGPFLPKPSGPATAPATGPTTRPSSEPGTKPTAAVGAASRAALGDGETMLTILEADAAPATQTATAPSAPATQPAEAAPTTQPTTQPVASVTPATGPSTGPTTSPAVAAATQPAIPPEPPKPPTQWIVASKNDADANDETVTQFLSDLNPLRAVKYLDKVPAPATQPSTQPTAVTYVVTVKTVAAGGANKTIEVRITDPGHGAKPYGQYQDLIFELDASIIQKLKGDFTEPPKEPAMPRGGQPGGFPGGGFPGGLPPGLR